MSCLLRPRLPAAVLGGGECPAATAAGDDENEELQVLPLLGLLPLPLCYHPLLPTLGMATCLPLLVVTEKASLA